MGKINYFLYRNNEGLRRISERQWEKYNPWRHNYQELWNPEDSHRDTDSRITVNMNKDKKTEEHTWKYYSKAI